MQAVKQRPCKLNVAYQVYQCVQVYESGASIVFAKNFYVR